MAARVLVRHEPRRNSKGDVTGVTQRQNGHAIADVEVEYLHTDNGNRIIRTRAGDTWAVRAVDHKDYQFMTVGGNV